MHHIYTDRQSSNVIYHHHSTRAQEHKSKELSKADRVLREMLAEINTVSEWAAVLGFKNEKNFSRRYRNEKGKRPNTVLIKMKLDRALYLLENKPELSCYEISRIIGKPDEKALNKFFKRHTGKAPSYFREKK